MTQNSQPHTLEEPIAAAHSATDPKKAARSQLIDEFLTRNGWEQGKRSFLAGDASFRNYERVIEPTRTAVLMDAPPSKEPIKPFITVDDYLVEAGFSAPKIYARDIENGFLLLQDLGNESFTRILENAPQRESELYMKAADVLVALHQKEPETSPEMPELAPYDKALLLKEVELFTDWYLPAALGEEKATQYREAFLIAWEDLLDSMPFLPPVMVLRDFHADNLMWLSVRGQNDIKQVGLLDFQDAVMGCPAYDLVSFLEDARRDIEPETAQITLNHYLQQMAWDRADFMTSYAILGAQRNCKIIGIFSRLAQRDGKHHYLEMLPRVWGHLQHDLQHGALRPLRELLDAILPEEMRGIPDIPQRKAS